MAKPQTVNFNTDSKVANYLTQAISTSGVTQKELATKIGYKNPNVISMFKKAETKIPLNKVFSIAGAIDINPEKLMTLVLNEYHPGLFTELLKIYGTGFNKVKASSMTISNLTKEEVKWVMMLRDRFKDTKVPGPSIEALDTVKAIY